MEIEIRDDFDLKKIVDSGQCFRPKEIRDGWFRFIVGENILHIRERGENFFEVDCSADDWQRVWENYFDLQTNYAAIRRDIEIFAAGKPCEKFLHQAANFGAGIRILRQAPFEMLISYIISQRKNIPAIRSSVEKICERFGRRVETNFGEVQLFPTVDEISGATLDDLTGLGLAYRKNYILAALKKVSSGEINLAALENFSDTELVDKLKTIHGVGEKISNCVALFAYHRVDRAPVDVWIARAIENDFGGENIFETFGKNAGILQQYVFYFKRSKR
ncbi:MAG: hypothetical protein IJ685_02760 [Selenomonadaceae bacterium]|nr:hypothetical protein [Selenomonadaceae bacterium]